MAPVTDDSDVLYIDEYGETEMTGAAAGSAFIDIGMAQRASTRRYRGIDDLPPDLIDSIILNLLEDFARLDRAPDAAPLERSMRQGDPAKHDR